MSLTIKDEYDFNTVINILLKNGYTITATAVLDIDNIDVGIVLQYEVNYEKLQ